MMGGSYKRRAIAKLNLLHTEVALIDMVLRASSASRSGKSMRPARI
jgi:hypothetical protein